MFSGCRGTAAIGPLIAALKDGRSVTYEGKEVPRQAPPPSICRRRPPLFMPMLLFFLNFSQIRPEQVCTPTDPGPVFVVVECPGEEFVGSLCTSQTLKR